MEALLSVFWNCNPSVVGTLGLSTESFDLRWYGLLFSGGFYIGYLIFGYIFKREGKSQSDLDVLTWYMLLGTVIGARLGHCLLYEPDYFLKPENLVKILYVWQGGLASHGGAFGIFLALWLFVRSRPHFRYLWLLDRMVIVVALGGAMIRLGNLANGEIVGKPTESPVAFVFVTPFQEYFGAVWSQVAAGPVTISDLQRDTVVNGVTYRAIQATMPLKPEISLSGIAIKSLMASRIEDQVKRGQGDPPLVTLLGKPDIQLSEDKNVLRVQLWGIGRYPAQLFEAITMLLLFVLLLWRYMKTGNKLPQGQQLGIFLTWCFGLRFFYETLKENQVAFESQLPLNMGQLLSIPLVMVGVWLVFQFQKSKAWFSFRSRLIAFFLSELDLFGQGVLTFTTDQKK